MEADAAGRIATRTVAGRSYSYSYDAEGRLTAYTDAQDGAKSATYTYDHAGRRIGMTVGGTIRWRFVYDGPDVVAEYRDDNGDDVPEFRRIYWLLPEMDQRLGLPLGFRLRCRPPGSQSRCARLVGFDAEGNAAVYYYLTDQVIDAAGACACDAFGVDS